MKAEPAYFNENNPYAAQWLRNLIDAGHIAHGVVDERSIEDVHPRDLDGFAQCHFFAGIGVWSHALRLAGWPDDRPVWTGSCPCQPFSAAGKGAGFADERHLWPAWHHLIRECRPGVVFGEQVASKDGLAWLDLVHADMEAAIYAFGAADLCAAGVGAPHIRQRLFFVGHANGRGGGGHRGRTADAFRQSQSEGDCDRQQSPYCAEPAGTVGYVGSGGVGHLAGERGRRSSSVAPLLAPWPTAAAPRLEGRDGRALGVECATAERGGGAGALADDDDDGRAGITVAGVRGPAVHDADRCGPVNGFWSPADWIACRDGKARPVEPGTFPLAHGAPARVGRLRAYGNAIVAPLAAEWIGAYLDGRG